MAARRRRSVNPQRAERRQADRAKKRQQGENIKPFIIGGVGLVVLVGGLLLVRAVTRANQPVEAKVEQVVHAPMDEKNSRAKDVRTWVESLQGESEFSLVRHSDLGALGNFLGVGGAQDAVLNALYTGEKAEYIRDWNLTSVGMKNLASADGERGHVVAYFDIADKPEKRKLFVKSTVTAEFAFLRADGVSKVTGWNYTEEPVKRKIVERPKVETAIGKVKEVTRMINGQEVTVTEAEPVPLDHFDDTPEDVRRKIDSLIEDLKDPNDPARANRAQLGLDKIGKPSMPRLLNALYETKLEGITDLVELENRVHYLRKVAQTLEVLSGNRFAFDVRIPTNAEEAKTSETLRYSAVRQWYAWWRNARFEKDWQNFDDEEDLLEDGGR